MLYKIGDHVGYQPVEAPISVPLPSRWYMLRVYPNRESKVMKAFRLRNISAYLPVLTSMQEFRRFRGSYEWIERRNVTGPLITGCVLLPDFEVDCDSWKGVDGTIGLLRFGDFTPWLTPKLLDDIRKIEAIGNTPKSKRERHFEVGQLVRVLSGPFRHFSAQVERIDSKTRLTVGVQIFGRITPVDLAESDIEAV
ncbi:transcriptional antiterminator NusG [Bradyrhizobium sp. LM2.7]